MPEGLILLIYTCLIIVSFWLTVEKRSACWLLVLVYATIMFSYHLEKLL